ncbi:MAG: hypothetical protein CO141_01095 [Candidatus Moranbacteria bacterium CG_4_9_14_3_um_filter_42_9]|nr:MAG: hypothetical protein CO141_01095 [Candidatus Moranbacteria bacterium CG_4_9_14_3_um_filter_42_9]
MKISKIRLAFELVYLWIRALTYQEIIYWIKVQARIAHACLHEFCGKVKRSIWNRGILLAWYRLWIRKDEFHKSLSLDPFAIRDMDTNRKFKYLNNLARRRNIAHQRDMQSESGLVP